MPPKTQTHYHCGGCEQLLEASQFTEAQKVGRYDQRRRCIACLAMMRTLLETGELPGEQQQKQQAQDNEKPTQATSPPWLAKLGINAAHMKPDSWLPVAELLAGDSNKALCDFLSLLEFEQTQPAAASLSHEQRSLLTLAELLLNQVCDSATTAAASNSGNNSDCSDFLNESGLEALLHILTRLLAALKQKNPTEQQNEAGNKLRKIAFDICEALVVTKTSTHGARDLPFSHRAAASWFSAVAELAPTLDDKQKALVVPLSSLVATAARLNSKNNANNNRKHDLFRCILALSPLILLQLVPLSPIMQQTWWLMIIDYAEFARTDPANYDIEVAELSSLLCHALNIPRFSGVLQPQGLLTLHQCLRAIVLACPIAEVIDPIVQWISDWPASGFVHSATSPITMTPHLIFRHEDHVLCFGQMLTNALLYGNPGLWIASAALLVWLTMHTLVQATFSGIRATCKQRMFVEGVVNMAVRLADACEKRQLLTWVDKRSDASKPPPGFAMYHTSDGSLHPMPESAAAASPPTQRRENPADVIYSVLSLLHLVHFTQTDHEEAVECFAAQETVRACFRLAKFVKDTKSASAVLEVVDQILQHGPRHICGIDCNIRIIPELLKNNGAAVRQMLIAVAPFVTVEEIEMHQFTSRKCVFPWFVVFNLASSFDNQTMMTQAPIASPEISSAIAGIALRCFSKMTPEEVGVFLSGCIVERLIHPVSCCILTPELFHAILKSVSPHLDAAKREFDKGKKPKRTFHTPPRTPLEGIVTGVATIFSQVYTRLLANSPIRPLVKGDEAQSVLRKLDPMIDLSEIYEKCQKS